VHAQLTFGNGMIMPSSDRDGEFGRLMVHPDERAAPKPKAPMSSTPKSMRITSKPTRQAPKILIAVADQD
jgi:hypothetical protein